MVRALLAKHRCNLNLLGLCLFCTVVLQSCDSPQPTSQESSLDDGDELTKSLQVSTDDLPAMLERRIIRVLVSYNQTNYFSIGGVEKGFEYELMKKLEAHVNKKARAGTLKVHIIFLTVPFSKLVQGLIEGKGDIAAAGLTVTPGRRAKLAFSLPYITNVDEIVVKSKDAEAVPTAEDLSGRSVIVTKGSSYVRHLDQLNERLNSQHRASIHVIIAGTHLVTEDLLQMVSAGIYDYTIADSHIAQLWSSALPGIVLQKTAVINRDGKIAWAVRKDNPRLLALLNQFARKHQQGTLLGNILLKRYYEDTKWVVNPLTEKRKQQLAKYHDLFKKYAAQYEFDWQFIAALAFQESKLNQNARSHAGAVGIMQIKPSTAAGEPIAIKHIKSNVENNIHAGTKYLAFLRDRYFSDGALEPLDQFAFTAAAYNAGPAKIRRLRKQAAAGNLDPDKWFNNVEYLAKKKIGNETTQYVANIYKYYVSYKTSEVELKRREQAIDQSR